MFSCAVFCVFPEAVLLLRLRPSIPFFCFDWVFILFALTYDRIMSRKNKKQQRINKSSELQKPFIFESEYDLVVIGGGAAGLACALACAQEVQRLGASQPRILVLEAGKRLGASILRSGNGRCNFSNAHVDENAYRNADFVKNVCAHLKERAGAGSNPVLRWFESLGLVWREMPHSGGLLYPYSNKAFSVLEVLQGSLDEHHVDVRTGTRVLLLENIGSTFHLDVEKVDSAGTGREGSFAGPKHSRAFLAESGSAKTSRGMSGNANTSLVVPGQGKASSSEPESPTAFSQQARISAKQVVFAAGGSFEEALASSFVEVPLVRRPVLGPLRVTYPKGVVPAHLDGIRMQALLSIPQRGFNEEGELLFREYGISGIVTFNASRYAQKGDAALLDLVPDVSLADLEEMLEKRLRVRLPEKDQFFKGFLLPEVSEAVFCAAERSALSSLQNEDIPPLAHTLKAFPLQVVGIADERQCQVRRGGIPTEIINAATLETTRVAGLYVIGEALDVDGPCGGYNLHWAWTTGLLSGLSVADNRVKGSR